jgi:hypothetical protein
MAVLFRSGTVATLVFTACSVASAHHAFGPVYDQSQVAEFEGDVTRVAWRNPHISFTVSGVDESGQDVAWNIETNSVSIVSRFGLTPDLVGPGTRVRIAGNPSRAGDHRLWLTNMLLPDGREILFGARYQARWSQQTVGEDIRADITADPTGSLGFFRVWTNGGPRLWNDDYPLTAAAEAARANHDPVRDDPTANCAPKGMPYIMEEPYPIEFHEEDGAIVLRLEEYDTVRHIDMSANAPPENASPTLLGHSVGHWDDDETLVVRTTGIDYPFFNATGIPHSTESVIDERFTLSDDGSRLDYEMTVTDPVNFTEPVTMTKFWNWRPGEVVRPYNCTP